MASRPTTSPAFVSGTTEFACLPVRKYSEQIHHSLVHINRVCGPSRFADHGFVTRHFIVHVADELRSCDLVLGVWFFVFGFWSTIPRSWFLLLGSLVVLGT